MNPADRIDLYIAALTDWRGNTLARIRKCIREADREIIEEWKWMGSPVWSRDGIIAVGNAHKEKVKLTFAHGASLPDPDKLFNAGLGGNAWRAIDFFEGDKVNERALKNLIRAAVDYHQIKLKRKTRAGTRAKAHKSKRGRWGNPRPRQKIEGHPHPDADTRIRPVCRRFPGFEQAQRKNKLK